MFKLNGIVKLVNQTVQISEKFAKREFVVTDASSMYPQDILFQATQDKCSLLDGVQPNDQVEVSFNLRGREWTSPQGEVKHFNTLEAWRIDKVGATGGNIPQGGPSSMSLDNNAAQVTSNEMNSESADDDLPF
jgi:hypothetical protein